MAPLALTSSDGAIAALGGRLWRRLHWLAYPALAHAVYHFGLMVGRDKTEALSYTGIVIALLGERIGAWWTKRRRAVTSATTSLGRR
jgi:sulfoxide reductase heme-binding subunit YedZ